VHEAIAQIASDHPGGTIVEVVEKGYRHADQVLRPTRVVVASEPPAPSAVERD
jgi:molecular chaperone GrpE (heat shock protein)